MQSGATTIPCPHCGAKLPVGARFCGDCGKAIVPGRQSPRPDDITVVDPPADVAPLAPRSKPLPRPDDITVVDPPAQAPVPQPPGARRPLPDEVTEVDLSAPAPQPPGGRRPRPDDITLIDPPVGAAPAPSRSMPRPDDITVVDPPAQAAPPQTPRTSGPSATRAVELPINSPAAVQGAGTPAPGVPTWGTVPGQSAPAAGWSSSVGNPSPPLAQYTAPAAVHPPFSGPQPVVAPLSGSPAQSSGQPVALPPPQFPIISGTFPLKKRTVFSSKGGKIALAVLVLLIIAGIVSIFFIVQSISRHGLPNDIPLPSNANYVKTLEQLPQDRADEAWVYTVSNTQPSQVIDFYQAQLPSNGWGTLMRASGVGSPGAQGSDEIVACKANKAVQIDATRASLEGVAAPSGGVTLEIILRPASEMQNCV